MTQVTASHRTDRRSSQLDFNDWIDRELVRHADSVLEISSADLDALLEMRELISRHQAMAPALVVRRFYRLRSNLEDNFYLLCYRLRNWLAVHYQLSVTDPLDRAEAQFISLNLAHRDFGSLVISARQKYFEEAGVCLNWSDIRIQVVAKS